MSGTEQPMDSSIVAGFQNLQVLTAYDFQRMDELVNDLTNALDESTKNKKGERSASEQSRASGSKSKLVRKKKCKKRKSLSHANSNWQQGNISEASESSLDEAIKDYIGNMAQQSDSDEFVLNAQRLKSLSSLPNQVLSFAESDSVTENISPMRTQRRRRRQFKRMAVDPAPSIPLGEQQNRSSGHAPDSMDTREHGLPGKRKRSMKEKNNSFDFGSHEEAADKNADAKQPMDINM
jgi:G patch domain-containing protein 2